ncbi:hypothetical protein [Rhizorhabdus sp.]|uniref:hypothetical protein n=1 Tax=Rhizorhabdus sp. TaxID=1968843 RepID=UPI0025E48CA2|nr:hypothetical protein [Rhizorhabdus sp.]
MGDGRTISERHEDSAPPEVRWLPFVLLGIGAGCISALQPLLLELLRAAGKLDMGQIGLAATAEAAGMAIASTLAALCLPLTRLKAKAGLAIVAMLIANGGTILTEGGAIVALRFVNGAGAGMLLWALIGVFSRSAQPARLFAIYVTAQSVLALALSQAIGEVVAPAFGHSGAYGLLVAMNLAMLIALLWLTDALPGAGHAVRGLPGGRAIVALFAIAAFLAGIMSLWVYLLPVLRGVGFDARTAGHAVSIGIAAQIAGGLLAAILALRLGAMAAWIAGIAIAGAAVLLLTQGGSSLVMLTAAAAFGFVWIFVPPFQMPAVLAVDPSGRGAMLVGTAQLGGTVIGPLAAAPLVERHGAGAAATAALAWLALSLMLLVVSRLGSVRPVPAAA